MKTILISITVAGLFIISACNKDKTYDNHKSPLMQMMHTMSEDMDNMVMTMDPDHDFAMMMKRHHQGAIEMADYELANGTDNTIKNMAQMMKDDQMAEIAKLDSFMNAHTPSGSSMAFDNAAQAAMNTMDSDADAQKLNGKADHDFVHLMIQHHKGATAMANAELQYGQVPFIKNMAQMMKDAQSQEISNLQAWLNAGND